MEIEDNLVWSSDDFPLGGGGGERSVAVEGDLLRGDEEHSGNGASRGGQVAL